MTENESNGADVLVLSGVNLALLGVREPDIYGTETLDDHIRLAVDRGRTHGLAVEHLQSDSEATIVQAVAAARMRNRAIIINPGAFTHYSWAIHDALAAFDGPIVELHLSNPNGREPWRHTSVISPVADAIIAGLGGHGYALALDAVERLLR